MSVSYYELHITMQSEKSDKIYRENIRSAVEKCGWKFSAIDGDVNLGDGVKLYATRQLSAKRWTDEGCVSALQETAEELAMLPGITIVRRKVERVIHDDRSSKVRAACDGACPECHSDDYQGPVELRLIRLRRDIVDTEGDTDRFQKGKIAGIGYAIQIAEELKA